MLRYLITLQAPDRTGLVEQIAHAVSRHGGNWLDSELRHIDGIFAAILLLELPSQQWEELIENLECIDGLTLTFARTSVAKKPAKITALGINIEQFSSQYESASHTGVALFRATFSLGLDNQEQENRLTEALYRIGDDVVLDKLGR